MSCREESRASSGTGVPRAQARGEVGHPAGQAPGSGSLWIITRKAARFGWQTRRMAGFKPRLSKLRQLSSPSERRTEL